MNKEELKLRASKRRKIPEESWAHLLKEGYVDDALFAKKDDEEIVGYIIEQFDEHVAAFGGTRGRKQTVDEERNAVPVSLSASERERQAAYEAYVALRATYDDGTRWFRDKVLQNHLLTALQARDLIRSPAAQFFEANSFEFGGGNIPLIGHHATLDYYEREYGRNGEGWHCATVSVDPPGISKTVEKPSYEMSHVAFRCPGRKDIGDGRALHYVNERGRPRKVPVWGWSPLEQLRGLSEGLAQEYRWEPAQATMFVLTGEIPAIPPLKVTNHLKFTEDILDATTSVPRHIDATITITASPWVPTRTVTSNYREAQTRILGSSGGKPPSFKNLRLFRFVLERIQSLSEPAAEAIASRAPGHVKMPEGKELVDEWNGIYPQWAYKTSVGDLNTRQFWRDYHRIERTIAVGPPYQSDREATVQ